jgi:predicted NBD/HSP70 family sugar kinase
LSRLRRGSPGLIRDLNRAATLALIGSQGPIARVEIARRLSLSAATVTGVTRDLVSDGLIRVVEQGASSGGRPQLLLGLVADAAYVLGVKVAPDHLAIVRVNLDGEILGRAEESFDARAHDAVPVLAAHLGAWIDADSTRLLGIGLGVPGTVNAQMGMVDSPVLGWHSMALGPTLADLLGVPVLIDNDVNTLAVAERLYGRGRETEHFVTITVGVGVGLGIIVGGDLYRGARGGAGEFGHVPVILDGPECQCGMRGCLEAVVGDPALVRAAVAAGLVDAEASSRDGIERLRALADDADPAALQIYADAGQILGRAVAGLVNILSPQLVIVSGEGARAWPHLQSAFDAALRAATFESLREVPVEVDPWDDAKWARGAAALVLRATFAAPLYERQIEDTIRARLPGFTARAEMQDARSLSAAKVAAIQ